MTSMTANGVSTTTVPGTENYESFKMGGKTYVQYDYRHTDGSLFSCVKRTLGECRAARDGWLKGKEAA